MLMVSFDRATTAMPSLLSFLRIGQTSIKRQESLENVAGRVVRRFKSRRRYLRAVIGEKVDMEDHAARTEWVRKKRDLVGDVLGGVVNYLDEPGQGEEWKEREVKAMAERWEKR